MPRSHSPRTRCGTADSDDGGVNDGIEVNRGSNPNNPTDDTSPTSSDLEFEDPNEGDNDDDEGEVLSGSAADEIEDDDDDAVDGGDDDEGGSEDVATGTFAKPVDSTGFSGSSFGPTSSQEMSMGSVLMCSPPANPCPRS